MKKNNKDDDFLKAVNNHLNKSVDAIDEDTKAALHDMRREALSKTEKGLTEPGLIERWFWLRPAPVMAMASLVFVVSVSLQMTSTVSVTPSPALEDIPLLTAADDIELYDDLEFYQWLEAQGENG